MSSGRNRTVDGVDVIGVRSAREAAENQSFLRTAFTAVFVSEKSSDDDRTGRVQFYMQSYESW